MKNNEKVCVYIEKGKREIKKVPYPIYQILKGLYENN